MSDLLSSVMNAASSRGWLPRRRVEELMDEPGLAADQHHAALAGLRRINAAAHVAERMATVVIAWAREKNRSRLRLLDVACGGGDVPIGVARIARTAGIDVELTLVDRSETALTQASAAASAAGLAVTTGRVDATGESLDQSFDIVTNSLFLHHLDRDEVIAALKNMRRATRLLIISDLRRSVAGWMFAWVGCRVLSRSPIVHFDGPVSVRGAWTIEEMRLMAALAGMSTARISRQWPFRMVLRWEADA